MNRHQRRAAVSKTSIAGGTNAAATLQIGMANFQVGRHAEAERCFRQVLSYQPNNPDALHLIGCVYIQTDRAERGVASIQRAIGFLPRNAEFYSNLAAGFSRLNRFEEAADAYACSVDLNATSAIVFNDWGKVLEKIGKTAPALAAFAQAVTVDPMLAVAHGNLGRMLHKFERYQDALTSFDAAAALAPENESAFSWRSAALFAMKRFDEALAAAEAAITVSPESCEPQNLRAIALYRLGRLDEALEGYTKALSFDPHSAEVHLNRSSVYVDLHRFEESVEDIDAAIRLQPDYAEAHNNKGLHCLLLGDFEPGWRETEWRWKCPALKLKDRNFAQPLWLGDAPVAGKTILLHSDQGLGDAINFARYATLVAAKGAHVILAVDAPLVDVLATIEGVADCVDIDKSLPPFDLHCSLSSLPLAFATRLETIPAAVPYVRPRESARWRERLGEKRAPRIGLVWSGNPNHGNDHNRSLQFRQILPLFDLPLTFYSLQKDVRATDADDFAGCDRILTLGGELKDFSDTAALLYELDLLITADTSIAHIAGAIGVPTWIMLPYTPDWRWLLDRDDSPWYPTVRLFRQSESRSWATVIARIGVSLQAEFRCETA